MLDLDRCGCGLVNGNVFVFLLFFFANLEGEWLLCIQSVKKRRRVNVYDGISALPHFSNFDS